MCGRFFTTLPVDELKLIFGTSNPPPNYPARYNVAPTQPVLAVRINPATGERSLDALRWGLVPHWAKDLSVGARCINARAETIERTPAFREAFARRRCLIPASGFYEWQKSAAGKQPYAIRPKDEPLFAFAGLWENWRDRDAGEGGEWIRSCTIVTCAANALLSPIHERMPVILPREAWPVWLGETAASPDDLKALLRPYPPERLHFHTVSPRVNNVVNDDSSLAEPIMATGGVAV